jgi:hypothetical protein
MEILEVSVNEYAEVINTPYHVFGSAAFNNLNRNKCEEVFYLLFREGKYRLGIVVGKRGNSLYSPFSAPFGGYFYISQDIRLQYVEEATGLLKIWASEKGFSSISIILPPQIYEESFVAKQINCLWRNAFAFSVIDLSYSMDLSKFDGSYPDRIWHNARKNLRISMNSGLKFVICYDQTEKGLAYEIIQRNRESHGYPLRMSWQQVGDTVRLIQADFFLVYNDTQSPVASAIIFHVSEAVVQVIYWGDLPGYSEMKSMNFLAYKVFEYYKKSGKKIVDIGPSSEHSVPSYGLCEFKEGIGCRIDPKFTLIYNQI